MKIAIVFGRLSVKGVISIVNGRLAGLAAVSGTASNGRFELPRGGRLEVALAEWTLKRGAFPTLCSVQAGGASFTVALRDVSAACPVWIPEFQVAVLPADDPRSYAQVAEAVAARALASDFARFEHEPEPSYEGAARLNRDQHCPTWLGLGRDLRMFRVDRQEWYEYWGQVQPVYHSKPQTLGAPLAAGKAAGEPYPYY